MNAWLDLLPLLHAHAVLHAQLQAPAGWSSTGGDVARLYIMVSGSGTLHVADRDEVLQPGAVVLIPGGAAHRVGDADAPPLYWPTPVAAGPVPPLRLPGDGADVGALAITVTLGAELRERIVPLLPAALVAPPGASAWLDATVALLRAQVAAGGGAAVLAAVGDVLVAEVLAAHFSTSGERPEGWLAALAEPVLARATHPLHQDAAHPWTVEALAAAADVSRTVLFNRFLDVLGEAPGEYILRWRMLLARDALRRGPVRVNEVAHRVGYRSEAAFNRAFVRSTGSPPATWRRHRS